MDLYETELSENDKLGEQIGIVRHSRRLIDDWDHRMVDVWFENQATFLQFYLAYMRL